MTTRSQAWYIMQLVEQLRENLTQVTTRERADWYVKKLDPREVVAAVSASHGGRTPREIRAGIGSDQYEAAKAEIEARMVAARLTRIEDLSRLTHVEVDKLSVQDASDLIRELKSNRW